MAFVCVPGPVSRVCDPGEYACVGAPPEKEVYPEPRENGATLAAIARVLRGALQPSHGPAHRGPEPEQNGW